jgi:hypothetical protein
MTLFGWLFMAISWTLIIALLVFCFSRVLSEKEEDL